MKKSNWIFASALFAFLLSTSVMSAQRTYDYNAGYDYDDNIVIVNDYGTDRNYRDGDRRRNKKRIREERRWKASIIDRAYRIAQADGRISRGERREIRKLERELGIYRKGRNNNRNRR